MLSFMPDPPSNLPDASGFKQFIRPMSFDVHSTAERLVLRGKDFAGSVKFADAISGGVATELADVLLETNGCHSKALGPEDT